MVHRLDRQAVILARVVVGIALVVVVGHAGKIDIVGRDLIQGALVPSVKAVGGVLHVFLSDRLDVDVDSDPLARVGVRVVHGQRREVAA